MRYSIKDSDGKCLNLIEWDGVTPLDLGDGLTLAPADSSVAIATEPTPVTPDNMSAAIDDLLDQQAVALGYTDTIYIMSYIGSNIPKFAAESEAFSQWRDAIWRKATTDLVAVNTGEMPVPESIAAYIATLPQFAL